MDLALYFTQDVASLFTYCRFCVYSGRSADNHRLSAVRLTEVERFAMEPTPVSPASIQFSFSVGEQKPIVEFADLPPEATVGEAAH